MERFRLFETKDYSVFDTFECNRKVDSKHVAKLVLSIKRYGLTSPIVVSNDGNVIDGQHRLAALIKLNLPIAYIVVNNYNIKQLEEINTLQVKWKLVDYVRFEASLGNQDCRNLQDTFEQYDFVSPSLLTLMFGAPAADRIRDVKSGKYSFDRKRGEQFIELLHNIAGTVDIKNFKKVYSTRFVSALKTIMRENPHFDGDRLISAAQQKPLRFYDNLSDNVERIIEVYNHRYRGTKLEVSK